MVLRIRDLLYEEKFTIAGARKRLAEENRKGATPRLRTSVKDKALEVEPENDMDLQAPDEYFESDDDLEMQEPQPATPPPSASQPAVEKPATQRGAATQSSPSINQLLTAAIANQNEQGMSPRAQLALRVIKRDLEDLLTLLKSDASIKRST